MGWSFNCSPQPKKSFIAEITHGADMVRVVGNHVWCIFTAGSEDDRHKIVVLCLLAQDKGCWGYKDMDESAGPHYYTCPLSVLKQSELRSKHAKEWAENVRLYHRTKAVERKATVEVGKSYTTKSRKRITILRPYRRGSWVARYPCGTSYRVTKNTIAWQ